MNDSQYYILSLLYGSDSTYTYAELLNAARKMHGTYPSLSVDIDNLISESLIKYRDINHSCLTPLQLTCDGRHVYESERKSRKESSRKTAYKIIGAALSAVGLIATILFGILSL